MKRPNELREAEEFFHQNIPLTRAMGLRVVAGNEESFVVEAPVALNYNHLHTAFGGSINAVATLAAYGLLRVELPGDAAQVVIAESSIRFLQPVRERIRGVCARPAAQQLEAFLAAFRTSGKARITLQVRVEEAGKLAAEFAATFVALRSRA